MISPFVWKLNWELNTLHVKNSTPLHSFAGLASGCARSRVITRVISKINIRSFVNAWISLYVPLFWLSVRVRQLTTNWFLCSFTLEVAYLHAIEKCTIRIRLHYAGFAMSWHQWQYQVFYNFFVSWTFPFSRLCQIHLTITIFGTESGIV